MSFKMKYAIEQKLLPNKTKRRSGILMPRVGFVVAHDTGNPGSTATGNISYYTNSANDISASAHTFIDGSKIIECIPATIGTPEKAWHVLYNRTKDNELFGDDSNDIAIGVELCYGESYKDGKLTNKIDDKEAYKRYVWYIAYVCYKFNLDPATKITGHFILDPGRKTDPGKNALPKMGITWEQFLKDVVTEYRECAGSKDTTPVVSTPVATIIQMGDKDNNVVALQTKLNVLGYGLIVDGNFGIGTLNAVKTFQKTHGLTADGVAGPATLDKLNALLNEIKEQKETEDDEPMKLEGWQKTTMVNGITSLSKVNGVDGKPLINSPDVWLKKIEDGTITAGEIAVINFAITVRQAVK
ncbi:N-acetylmuramoyl-L-alanine amidase (plasmid) [Paenibacillus peoriae]|uniref:N-acetylmuramoyl-L-alanine amidase n=1 Tax=Paenibacillus peoriae TaxID=59893 RepID=A0A7H0YH44_9BACL|nr:N-acetylmuramoyl-L-alanine amidase [Paenibacillus peoriae]QNR70402.1 N-acetylmuramoyl-L-alanine amidase [Paenibacillus peoriae]